MNYKPRGMRIEQLLATPIAERQLTSASHSAPCVRVPWHRRSEFEAALIALRNEGLFVVVVPDVALYRFGTVRVHRVHISNDADYLASFVGAEEVS